MIAPTLKSVDFHFKKMSSVMNSALLSYLLFTSWKDSMCGRVVMMFELRLDLLRPAELLPEVHPEDMLLCALGTP